MKAAGALSTSYSSVTRLPSGRSSRIRWRIKTERPIDQRIGGFYQSCTDEAAIEKRGTEPLKPELDRIAAISQKQQLLDEVARLHKEQVYAFFNFGSTPNPNDASMNIGEVDQGGIGLPEKDFYFRTDARSVELRKKYVAHIGKMFELIGVPAQDASAKAAKVMAIETALAKVSLDVTSRRNPQLLVHEMSKDATGSSCTRIQFQPLLHRVVYAGVYEVERGGAGLRERLQRTSADAILRRLEGLSCLALRERELEPSAEGFR